MPGMEAGIQFRRDAPGNVHVNLDSNTPCWNDAIGERLELIQALPTLFSKKGFPIGFELRALRKLRGEISVSILVALCGARVI